MAQAKKMRQSRAGKQSSRSIVSEAIDRSRLDPRATWYSLLTRPLTSKKKRPVAAAKQ